MVKPRFPVRPKARPEGTRQRIISVGTAPAPPSDEELVVDRKRGIFHVKTILTASHQEAAEFIKRGGIVAFPTETVYGLGADIFNEKAVARIFDAKRRPADNPLIAHIGDIGQLTELSDEVSDCARRFIDAFFPGPLTIVVGKSSSVSGIATAGLDTIGIRMPRFAIARQFSHRLFHARRRTVGKLVRPAKPDHVGGGCRRPRRTYRLYFAGPRIRDRAGIDGG